MQSSNASSFVPVREPAPREAPSTEAVSAKWKDNLGAWIGVFVGLMALRFLAQLAAHTIGLTPSMWPARESLIPWTFLSACMGALAFAGLMIWRSALDEREKAGAFLWLENRVAELEELLEEAEEANVSLEIALHNTRLDLSERIVLQQQATAQSTKHYTPTVMQASDEPVDRQVYLDARMLVERACRNQPYSKGKMESLHGWTQARWRAAHQLALSAGLFRVVNRQTELLIDDLNTALSMMDLYAGISVSQAD